MSGATGGGRNFRSADLWFESVGLLLADDGTPLGMDVPTQPYKEAHFATFSERLVTPLILAGTSAKGVCSRCGSPWERVLEKERTPTRPGAESKVHLHGPTKPAHGPGQQPLSDKSGLVQVVGNRDPERHVTSMKTIGWRPTCSCGCQDVVPAVVLDPFAGSGTTLAVAVARGRRAVGCELNPEYAGMARRRIGGQVAGFF